MKALKRQIRESFLNPILYFLPLLTFMVVDDFCGLELAWKISFPVAFLLLFYVYFNYRSLILWHVALSGFYLVIGLITTVFAQISTSNLLTVHSDEILFVTFIGLFLTRKSFLEQIATKTLPYKMPMSNNVNELFRLAKLLVFIVLIFVIVNSLFMLGKIRSDRYDASLLKYMYSAGILTLIVYETIRVFGIRSSLLREDWLPIVNGQGKVTGSSQYQPDSINDQRLMHPVVRLYFIDNDMLFLLQRKDDDNIDAMLWDASVSRHVRMNESVEQSLKIQSKNIYGIEPSKSLFLTNYIYRGTFDDQYIYLFIFCKSDDVTPHNDKVESAKWWTTKQIEENFNSGIFTERFKQEFELLKRSGVLERDFCNCECALKDLVKHKVEVNTSLL